MAERYHSDEAVNLMVSLGAAFRATGKDYSLDPESSILKSLRFYWEYNTVFFMVLACLRHRISHLIHVDRLIKLAKQSQLPDEQLILLMAICESLGPTDHRFFQVKKKLYEPHMKFTNIPEDEADPFFIESQGLEPSLKPFKVTVRKFYEEPEKKLFKLEKTLTLNQWLKFRALFGPNYRADIIYLLVSQRAQNPTQAAKLAQCSRQAAHVIHQSIEKVPDLERLLVG